MCPYQVFFTPVSLDRKESSVNCNLHDFGSADICFSFVRTPKTYDLETAFYHSKDNLIIINANLQINLHLKYTRLLAISTLIMQLTS